MVTGAKIANGATVRVAKNYVKAIMVESTLSMCDVPHARVSVLSPEIFPDNGEGGEREVALDDDGAEDEDQDGVERDGRPSTEM